MSVLLHFVFVASELAILEPGSEAYREHRLAIEKNDKEGLLEGMRERRGESEERMRGEGERGEGNEAER